MKKSFIVVIMAALIASCSNGSESDPMNEPEMVDVSFNVSPFTVTDEPMSRTASAAADVLDQVEFYLVNTANNKYAERIQVNEPGVSSFGSVTMRLSEGTYKMFVWGCGKNSTTGEATFNQQYGNELREGDNIDARDKDIFALVNNELKIEKATKNVDCLLKRETAKLTIQIQDKKPADVDRVEVIAEGKTIWCPFLVSNSKPLNRVYKYITAGSDGTFGEADIYMFPYEQTELIFLLLDSNHASVGETRLTVPLYKNRRTIVRGNLFDVIAGKGFNVTVDDTWGEDHIVDMK